MPPAISWQTVENAIQAWVAATSGLAGDHCIWGYQGGPAPGYPYIELDIAGVHGIGQPWKKKEYDADADELVVKVTQHQTAVLTLQYFADQAGAEGTTGREAIQVMTDVLAGIDLYEDELDDGGVGIGETSAVQYIPPSGGGILHARSVATVDLHLQSELEKREDYVATVKATIHTTAQSGDLVDIDLEVEL